MTEVRIGFTGHQGLNTHTSRLIRDEIDRLLEPYENVVGLCSLAEGADQIFASSLLASGGRLIAVIPCNNYESTFTNDQVLNKYRTFLNSADSVINLNFPDPNEEAFWGAGQKVVEESDTVFAVWDGKESRGLGGTGDVVKYARELGKQAVIVWPPGSARD